VATVIQRLVGEALDQLDLVSGLANIRVKACDGVPTYLN